MKDINSISETDKKAKALLEIFRRSSLTFCAAESCTGGLVNTRLTALPGSSDVVMGGVVSYSNSVKENVLSVSKKTLLSFGAVSEQTAFEMAEGVRRLCRGDIGVSVTGIAGPGGGSEEKPVGTVCFGVSYEGGCKTVTKYFGKDLERGEIRRLAADFAMELAMDAAAQIN